jgi:very-short-patch-repair endonuclease
MFPACNKEQQLASAASRLFSQRDCTFLFQPNVRVTRSNCAGLEFLLNERTGRYLQPDVVCQALRLILEYNGPTHYRHVDSNNDSLKRRLARDAEYALLAVSFFVPVARFSEYLCFRLYCMRNSSCPSLVLRRAIEHIVSSKQQQQKSSKNLFASFFANRHAVALAMRAAVPKRGQQQQQQPSSKNLANQLWAKKHTSLQCRSNEGKLVVRFMFSVMITSSSSANAKERVLELHFHFGEQESFQAFARQSSRVNDNLLHVHVPAYLLPRGRLVEYVLTRLVDDFQFDNVKCRCSLSAWRRYAIKY